MLYYNHKKCRMESNVDIICYDDDDDDINKDVNKKWTFEKKWVRKCSLQKKKLQKNIFWKNLLRDTMGERSFKMVENINERKSYFMHTCISLLSYFMHILSLYTFNV